MCAIFGFISRGISAPDLGTLAKIIKANIARGPHAFGLAWLDRSDRLHCYKQQGRLTDQLAILAMAKNARMLIGHLRYATHGEPSENINNHPHATDGGWLVHNGVVSNYRSLMKSRDLWPMSECDSESVALMIAADAAKGIMKRCINSVQATTGNLAILGLWKPGELVAVRRGNPLHLSDTPDGTYLATMSAALPGKVVSVRDNTAVKFSYPLGGTRDSRVQTFATVRENHVPDHDGRAGLFESYRGG